VNLMQPTASELALPQRPNSNSWLLALDDARAGRAGVEPVVHDPSRRALAVEAPLQLDTSFAETPPVASRTFPWLMRGLIAVAAGSFLFVVGHTVFSPKRPDSKIEVVAPVAPRRTPVETRAELADPGPARVTPANETKTASARNPRLKQSQPVPQSPARPAIPEAVAPLPTAIPRPEDPPPTFIEIPPPDFAPVMNPNGAAPNGDAAPAGPEQGGPKQASAADYQLPPWYPGLVSSTPLARGELAPSASELSGSRERKERVQRYLMEQSRAAAPLADASPDYVPPVQTASLPRVGGVTRAAKPNSKAAPKSAPPAVVAASAPRASSVWEGAVVPVDQIASKEQILTPRVGLVRVTLASGDVKEGRLHAVGQSQIWIDQPRGHEAIARSRIERLEQVGEVRDPLAYPGEKTTPKTTAAGTDKNADKRVRVRTASGLFYGKIVARDGDSLTLLTDEGSSVTIEGGSIELAPERKTIVKRDPPAKPITPKLPPPVPSEPDEDPNFDPNDPHGGQSHQPPAPKS